MKQVNGLLQDCAQLTLEAKASTLCLQVFSISRFSWMLFTSSITLWDTADEHNIIWRLMQRKHRSCHNRKPHNRSSVIRALEFCSQHIKTYHEVDRQGHNIIQLLCPAHWNLVQLFIGSHAQWALLEQNYWEHLAHETAMVVCSGHNAYQGVWPVKGIVHRKYSLIIIFCHHGCTQFKQIILD